MARLATAPADATTATAATARVRDGGRIVATSPAVGVFQPRPEARAGTKVRAGDRLGSVDMLGIPQEVVAPSDGVVGASLVEPGDAVEYGQDLILIEFASAVGPGGLTVFRKVLIANRGEIALRILRACRTLGAEAVVAYSEADRDSLPVQLADEAICIGPSDARRSYLSAPAVISAALVTGCDAIHPGLRVPVRGRGLRRGRGRPWPDVHRAVGGRPRAVRQQGRDAPAPRRPRPADDPGLGRDAARRDARPRRGGADRLPGPHQAVGRRRRQGDAHGPHRARARVGRCGSAAPRRRPPSATTRSTSRSGSTRTATSRSRSPSTATATASTWASATARSSAATRRSSRRPRRRPSPTRPGRTSRNAPSRPPSRPATRTSGRSSSWSTPTGDFFFIEINCRIQVEHPVTEILTGLDLVTTQIRIAAGEPLGFSQADVTLRGHAIEFRINAEDPEHEFRPGAGIVERYHAPGGPGVRMDSHLYSGYEVPPFYDSLLGKLIVWGPDRATAIARGRVALDELVVDGLVTNVSIHKALLANEAFLEGRMTTNLLDRVGSAAFLAAAART